VVGRNDVPEHSGPPEPPAHRQPLLIALVFVGGVCGSAVRYALGLAVPTRTGDWPTSTFVVNIAGAFVLGLLVEALVRAGADDGWRRRLRLFAGTGFCGALTTYSALAVESDLLVRGHHPGLAATYALVSVAAGLVATGLGITVSAALHHRAERGQP
jgi:CrcB protein